MPLALSLHAGVVCSVAASTLVFTNARMSLVACTVDGPCGRDSHAVCRGCRGGLFVVIRARLTRLTWRGPRPRHAQELQARRARPNERVGRRCLDGGVLASKRHANRAPLTRREHARADDTADQADSPKDCAEEAETPVHAAVFRVGRRRADWHVLYHR